MTPGLLRHAPTRAELERLYHELSRAGAPSVGRRSGWPYHPAGDAALFALGAEMLRYDARLLTVLLQLVLRRWRDLNPRELREQMAAMRWPQALCVVFSFARLATTDPELRRFADYVCSGWPRVEPPQRFFLDAARPGSRMAARQLGRNLAQYSRWGFIGSERPAADLVTKRTVGRYDAATRRSILGELLAQRKTVSLADCMEALDGSVTRQQALNDLRSLGLRVAGHGRSARWRWPRRTAAALGAARGPEGRPSARHLERVSRVGFPEALP